YNFAKRLKTLKGLTPYEYICKIWTNEPDRFKVDPFQHNVGLNILAKTGLVRSCLRPSAAKSLPKPQRRWRVCR
ncbi:MAG: hypothetical protein ACREC9_04965, partial [Methylocella sp.]